MANFKHPPVGFNTANIPVCESPHVKEIKDLRARNSALQAKVFRLEHTIERMREKNIETLKEHMQDAKDK